ncbi:hypothetical protein RFI_17588 [Reticulomyxa filosa]|uniref:Cytochrome b5 heme-binding domain-containing protein n=1 Tax=Reticulomyxa filosa TaxID=46433 RepID=X6N0N6_RETFI|nr:hypothetical protein RFI_17588 [Reticulomyxa filosa]|eukprot:ETO19641.1 hypothetical protein RFI_17588 [Reticulomyxa filosa]
MTKFDQVQKGPKKGLVPFFLFFYLFNISFIWILFYQENVFIQNFLFLLCTLDELKITKILYLISRNIQSIALSQCIIDLFSSIKLYIYLYTNYPTILFRCCAIFYFILFSLKLCKQERIFLIAAASGYVCCIQNGRYCFPFKKIYCDQLICFNDFCHLQAETHFDSGIELMTCNVTLHLDMSSEGQGQRLNPQWWYLHGKAYDFSAFATRHPGGQQAIFLGRGRDCTALFESYHTYLPSSDILAKYEIPEGIQSSYPLCTEKTCFKYEKDGYYAVVKQRAREYFKLFFVINFLIIGI